MVLTEVKGYSYNPHHHPCLRGALHPLASPVKLTVTATMMITMPRTMNVMLSSRARRPSLRAPSRSPCCTLLRDCRERAEKLQEACPSVTWAWKPCSVLVYFYPHHTFPATHSPAGHMACVSCRPLSKETAGKGPSNTRCFLSG